MMCHNYQ